MKFGTSSIIVNFDSDFIEDLDKWKKLIFEDGIKRRLKKLITQDLKTLKDSR